MKTLSKLSMWAIALLFGGLAIVACKDDKNTNEPDPDPVPAAKTPDSVATANLIAYFAFDDNLAEKITGVAATNHSMTFATGKKGKAIQGAASTYAVWDLPATTIAKLGAAKGYTISMWVKSPQAEVATAPGVTPWLHLDGGDVNMGSILIGLQDRNTTDAAAGQLCIKNYLFNDRTEWKGQEWWGLMVPEYPVNAWFHYTIVYDNDSSQFRQYSNGKFLSANVRFGGPDVGGVQPKLGDLKLINMTKLYLGVMMKEALGTAGGDAWMKNYFKGNMDEVRIYDRALKDAEVKELYDLEFEAQD